MFDTTIIQRQSFSLLPIKPSGRLIRLWIILLFYVLTKIDKITVNKMITLTKVLHFSVILFSFEFFCSILVIHADDDAGQPVVNSAQRSYIRFIIESNVIFIHGI